MLPLYKAAAHAGFKTGKARQSLHCKDWRAFCPDIPRQTCDFGDLSGPAPVLLFGNALIFQPKCNVPLHRHSKGQGVALEHHGNVPFAGGHIKGFWGCCWFLPGDSGREQGASEGRLHPAGGQQEILHGGGGPPDEFLAGRQGALLKDFCGEEGVDGRDLL